MGRRLNREEERNAGGSRDPPKTQPWNCGPINLTNIHTHRFKMRTRAFILVSPFLHICHPSSYRYTYSLLFFFLLHAWLNETPITFWTLGRICSTAAMQLRICLTVCWTTNGYGSTTWMKNLYKWRIIQNQPECELPVQTHDLLRDY